MHSYIITNGNNKIILATEKNLIVIQKKNGFAIKINGKEFFSSTYPEKI